jgi:Glycosyl hydrolases family 25
VTVFLRDMSHYDHDESLYGFAGTTHKVTEGSSFVDPTYAARMNRYRAAGTVVLGAYHVLHTADPPAQVEHWLSALDRATPWWRTRPGFVMQVDAEKWPDDPVTHPSRAAVAARTSTTLTFTQMLAARLPPSAWLVVYASRGQYGDTLRGLRCPLWNAAYHGRTYPGDTASDWAAYSGQVPVLWQYTSTPYDQSAFRGTLGQLLALTGGDDMSAQGDADAAFCRRWLNAYLNLDAEGRTLPVAKSMAALAALLADVHEDLAALTALVINNGGLSEQQLEQVMQAAREAARAEAVTAADQELARALEVAAHNLTT